jgi:hypothetical protein
MKISDRSQINNLIMHLKPLGKQKQANHKISIRRAIIKIIAQFNTNKMATF